MKTIVVLLLAFKLCCSDLGPDENDAKLGQVSGFASCCNICPLTSVTQTVGELKEKVANMEEKITFLETRLQSTEKEVLELRSLIGGAPQVAFSAALRDSGSGNTGPFTTVIPLQYKKVFSNTGNCYNPSTGVFTAMVSGMYFFRFSMFNNLAPTPSSVVSLMKNSERLTSVWDTSGTDSNDMGSNAVVIPLKVGDNVYVQLEPNRMVYDDSMNYNTFSGFLLFRM
ncbi:PREDICTED: complement C1q-like protein 2 [Cyprinodon variegatus]|uniref:complement C1q-like protein 2 n=1 Tax=Cyprinodon variegatus TaxID=28743 RepID=UPI000742C485|nr:PREDICTED: complement C1q-like protein 2 [Cyprinodon variegatus]